MSNRIFYVRCQFFYAVAIRSGVETRCFETETKFWGSETERRRDFGVAKPRRNFEVSRPRRDTRLYISCFGLSQGCGVRVGSRSRMFLVGVGTEIVF